MKKLLASLFLALTLVACGGGGDAPTACEAPIGTTTESPGPGPSIGGVTAQTYKPKPPVEVTIPSECDEVVSTPPPREQVERCLYGCSAGQWVWDQTNWAAVIEYNGTVSAIEYVPSFGVEIDQQIGAITEAQFTTVNISPSASSAGEIPAVDLRIIGDVYGRFNVRDLHTGTVLYNSFPQIVNGKRLVPIFRKRYQYNDY